MNRGHFGSMDRLVSKQNTCFICWHLFFSRISNHSTILGKSHYFSPNLVIWLFFPLFFYDFFFQFRALIIIYIFICCFFSSHPLVWIPVLFRFTWSYVSILAIFQQLTYDVATLPRYHLRSARNSNGNFFIVDTLIGLGFFYRSEKYFDNFPCAENVEHK